MSELTLAVTLLADVVVIAAAAFIAYEAWQLHRRRNRGP